MIVEFLGDFGPVAQRLDMVPAGTLVAVSGTVTRVQVLGADEPRAIVTLTGLSGESAQCAVDTERYLDVWDLLVEETPVQVCGKVRRPLKNMPALVDALAIRPAVVASAREFTLRYTTADGRQVRVLPRRGVETVGRLLMKLADRDEVWDIEVLDGDGGDVTFGFSCFADERAVNA
ncbi:hypothetical protein [Streptomyces sp. NPDC001404]|uniref:hypothetical protein n=1 Tax=Streptomyces sp. NPDC001404 TaxID=3364571 RepID=UPI003696B9A6